jgi:carbon monoxide dehydrogenase subunit G
MEMTGERLIMAPQMEVWAALNDPATLKDCIIGCDSIEKLSDTHMVATASIKLGPVSARFSGKLQLSDMNPPDGYTITGEATGGAAGFAKGGAVVRLATQSGATLLSYTVSAQVGGKIAQVGGRLIDATAKSMADQFFRKFAERLESPPAPIPSPDGLPAGKMIEKVGLLTRLWRWLTGRAE